MKILFIGDIVASPGRKTVQTVLPNLKHELNIDLVVANADNLAHGRGATESTLKVMQEAGVDFFTGGDHLFWHKDSEDVLEQLPVIRPANYPEGVAGTGHKLLDLGEHGQVLVISLMGRTFLNERLNDPFTTADQILEMYADKDIVFSVVDFHAEATSEKYALGFYLDGRVGALVGSHTHVPTSDTFVMPKGTMFVSDVGMTGIIDSVLGVKKEIILDLYLTALNQRFEWEEAGRKVFRSVLLDTQQKEISRVDYFDL